jgi:hypothetical protein
MLYLFSTNIYTIWVALFTRDKKQIDKSKKGGK